MLLNPEADPPVMNGCVTRDHGPADSKRKHTIPEHIGSVKCEGRVIGDSRFALEEKMFGGHLMHEELRRFPTFLVLCTWIASDSPWNLNAKYVR